MKRKRTKEGRGGILVSGENGERKYGEKEKLKEEENKGRESRKTYIRKVTET